VVGSTITATDLRDGSEAGKSIHLVDVREPAEYEIVRDPGSILVPKGEIISGEALAGSAPGQADRPLLQDRGAQRRGARRGQGAGFRDAVHVAGWRHAPGSRQVDPSLPVVLG
jgi:adenylyltransferase/sulfurtransferase